MKNLFALLTVIGTGFIAAPDAEARPGCHSGAYTYVSHHTSCGCPVYVQRYVAYYDRCGNPVYRTRTLSVNHRCRSHYGHGHAYSHGYPQVRHTGRGYSSHYRNHRSNGVRIGPVIVGGGSSRCR